MFYRKICTANLIRLLVFDYQNHIRCLCFFHGNQILKLFPANNIFVSINTHLDHTIVFLFYSFIKVMMITPFAPLTP
jgi:hypothetical protein